METHNKHAQRHGKILLEKQPLTPIRNTAVALSDRIDGSNKAPTLCCHAADRHVAVALNRGSPPHYMAPRGIGPTFHFSIPLWYTVLTMAGGGRGPSQVKRIAPQVASGG